MKLKFLIIFILIIAFISANYHYGKTNLRTPLINKVFPKKLDEWTGIDSKVSKSVFKLLSPDELLLRTYKNNETGTELSLAIVLTNKRAQIHDPEVCYRYQGIAMEKESIIPINKNDLVKHVLGSKKKQNYDILYWYTDLNKTFPERAEFMKQIALAKFLDKPIKGFALVVIIAPKKQNKETLNFSNKVNVFLLELGKN